MTLGHRGEDVCGVAGNKKQELTGDTGDENRSVSEQHRHVSRSRSCKMIRGPRMGSWVTSAIMRHFMVCTKPFYSL